MHFVLCLSYMSVICEISWAGDNGSLQQELYDQLFGI